jgi:hypothetical protein
MHCVACIAPLAVCVHCMVAVQIVTLANESTSSQAHVHCIILLHAQVRCSPDQKAITAIASSDGEVVDLCSPVTATEAVESWLHQLTDGMRAALQASLKGVAGLSDPFAQAPAQVLGLYHALSFTERCV